MRTSLNVHKIERLVSKNGQCIEQGESNRNESRPLSLLSFLECVERTKRVMIPGGTIHVIAVPTATVIVQLKQ